MHPRYRQGHPLQGGLLPGAYVNVFAGWYFDPEARRGTVHVKLPRMSTSEEVELVVDIDENLKIPASPPYPVPKVTPELDPTEFIVAANSQQGNSIGNAFDGTPETHWHSNYSKNPKGDATNHPYVVDIDLNGLYALNGFQYMARHDLGNGMIKDYELYVSRNKGVFAEPLQKGSFKAIKEMQTLEFPVVWGEFARIKILSAHRNTRFGSAAEFNVLRDLKAPPLEDKVVYLSDLKPDSVKGEFKNDHSIGGKPITVNGQEFKKGIGAKAACELVYKVDGSWDRLSGHVGMDDEVGDGGSVMFRVYADGKLAFESPSQTGKSIKQLMDLSIKGVKELHLVLLDDGDGSENDHGDWVDARLVLKGSE